MSLATACEKKKAYWSPEQARRVLEQRLAAPDGPEVLHMYRCQLPGCRLWHLTKMKTNQ